MERSSNMNEITVYAQGELAAPQMITEDLFSRFTAFIDAKPKTVQTYTRAVRQFYAFLYRRGITQPQRADVLAFRDELKATGHKPTTVQNYITATRLFFQWTAQEGIYPNIAEHIKGATLSKDHKKDYLTSKQVKRVLASIDRSTLQGKRDYAMLALMITGGLRTIEVSRADIQDIRTVGDDSALFIQGKGREEKEEYVKIQPPVEDAIREYLKARGMADMRDPLFASTSNNSKGGRLTTRSVSGIVKDRLVEAGFDSSRLTAHSLRHTAVTLSLLGGEDLQKVQQFARHSNLATTMIYAHNLDRAKNKCEATIANAIFK
jgi:integrase/recombinase XerC